MPKGNRAKNSGQPVSSRAVLNAFSEVGELMGLKLGTHSMRKTRGFHLYQDGMRIEQIAKILGHANPNITLRYVGLDQHMIDQSFRDYVL